MKQKPRSRVNRKEAKSVLRLPDLEHAKTAFSNSLTMPTPSAGIVLPSTSSLTGIALNSSSVQSDVVIGFRRYFQSRQLAPGTVNLGLGAVRRLANEAADLRSAHFGSRGWHSPRQRREETGVRLEN